MSNYRLMNNQLGYETNQTKKALIRSVDVPNEKSIDTSSSLWKIVDSEKNTLTSGALIYKGFSFGIELWEIDFSSLCKKGKYTLIAEIKTASGNETLSSLPFEIGDYIYSENILKNVSIYNGEARIAARVTGAGYNDCNTEMGETFSHGRFLYGLIDYYVQRNKTLSNMDNIRLIAQINRAFDYCMQLYLESGEIGHSVVYRFQSDANLGIHNTYWALMGMVYYIEVFKDCPRSNDENYEKLIKTAEYTTKNGYPIDSSNGLMAPVYYHLYKYKNDKDMLEKACISLKNQCEKFDMFKDVMFMSYVTHGLKQMTSAFPDHEDYPTWISFAKKLQAYFVQIRDNNAFHIMPSVWHEKAKDEWADMSKPMHVPDEWVYQWFFTTTILHTAIDALVVGDLLSDSSMEQVASGCVGFAFGINAGLPSWSVQNPASSEDYTSAALLCNAPCRHAQAWTEWSFEMKNAYWQSVPNGYVHRHKDIFEYDDDWASAETFIASDGVMLTALCEYENHISDKNKINKYSDNFNTNIDEIDILEGWWEETDEGMKLHTCDIPFCALINPKSGSFELSVDVKMEKDQRFALMFRGRPIVTMCRDAIAGNHITLSTIDNTANFMYKCQALSDQIVNKADITAGEFINFKLVANKNISKMFVNNKEISTLYEGERDWYGGWAGIWLESKTAVINNLLITPIE